MLQTGLGSVGEEAMEAAQAARTPCCPHPTPQQPPQQDPRTLLTCDICHRCQDPWTSWGQPGRGDGLSLACPPGKSWAFFLPPLWFLFCN